MATAHLICGPSGAGKTTYALRLRDELGAAHLAIDDWMTALYGPDAPVPPDWAWISDRVGRATRQIVATAIEMGRHGLSSVLDLSFLQAAQRAGVAGALRAGGVAPRLHVLAPDPATRWARVEARNAAQGETYRVAVSRPMFDFVETLWQPPSPEEMADLDGLRVA